jgi:di/tricarboxylate transporter
VYSDIFINFGQLFVFLVILISTYFFITEKVSAETVSIASVGILVLYFGIFFSNPLVIISTLFNKTIIAIFSLLIIGQTISYAGIINKFINLIVRIKNTTIIVFSLIFITYLISGFMNNTPIVIVLISLLMVLTEQIHISKSQVMMPIAFSASLGAMLTVLGSSTNVIIQDKLSEVGYDIGIFNFFWPGFFVSMSGLIYVLFLTKIIPVNDKHETELDKFSLILNPYKSEQSTFSSVTKKEIKNILYNHAFQDNLILDEVIINENSSIVGRSIDDENILSELNAVGFAIKSENKRILPGRLMLVIHRKEDNNDINGATIIKKNATYILSSKSAFRTLIIFFTVIFTSSLTELPLAFNAFLGVSLLIATKVINTSQIFKFIDTKILFMIIYAFVISKSMELVGLLNTITEFLCTALDGFSTLSVVTILFIVITLLNEVISNNAVALVFTPIMVGIGNKIGVPIDILIWTLVFASNAAFLTPIGYQTNLLVMQCGNYKFLDYLKFGLPLNIIVLVAYLFFLILFN